VFGLRENLPLPWMKAVDPAFGHPRGPLDRCTFRDQAGSSSVTGCQRLATIAAEEATRPAQQTNSTLLEMIIHREICRLTDN
jgi:hypothetical protein